MPQLDVYILFEFINELIFLWTLIYIINIYNLYINIYLILSSIKIKNFIEKQIFKNIYNEIYFLKNISFLKKNILLINWILDEKKKKILEDILDIYNISIKFFFFILKKKNLNLNSKNNIELYRNIF